MADWLNNPLPQTVVVASEIRDTTDVARLASPLSQERQVIAISVQCFLFSDTFKRGETHSVVKRGEILAGR